MSQKLRFPIVGPEPIKFGSKMPNFELKSQYLGHLMPRRGYFASITSNWFIGGLLFKDGNGTGKTARLSSQRGIKERNFI